MPLALHQTVTGEEKEERVAEEPVSSEPWSGVEVLKVGIGDKNRRERHHDNRASYIPSGLRCGGTVAFVHVRLSQQDLHWSAAAGCNCLSLLPTNHVATNCEI